MDAELVENVFVRVLFLCRDAVAGVNDDGRPRLRGHEAGRDPEDGRPALAVVVRAAVDGVAVGRGRVRVLGHHVNERTQLLWRVALPAVRQPERAKRRMVRLVVEDPPERLFRLRPGHVVGRLVSRADDLGHQSLQRPLPVAFGCFCHTRIRGAGEENPSDPSFGSPRW